MLRHVFIAWTVLSAVTGAIAAESVVFEDDFSDGVERWEVLDPATWRLNDDGTFEITARESAYKPPHRSPLHVALVKDVTVGDMAIEFRVKSTLDTGSHRDCCVFFGWQDPAHFYYVHLGALPDAASGQIQLVDGADRRPLTANKRPVPWTDGWHTVRLERHPATGRIAVYFDDLTTPLMETTDTTLGAGRVGIGSFDDCDAFDDVRVLDGSTK
ncbi:hypothetical protein [Botrimarina colliarenosi]|nr:hypothetical protein [Botrimarina colliarenosi]